jgi:predicted permease
MRLMSGFKRLLRLPNADVRRDVEDELQSHIEMKVRDLVEAGLDPDAAQVEARHRFGNLRSIRRRCNGIQSEHVRNTARGEVMDALWQDLRIGTRLLRKNPGFTAAAVLTLAIGIGATTAVFSVVDAVLLRPLPYDEPHQLVELHQIDPTRPELFFGVHPATFLDWRERNRVFTGVAAVNALGSGANLTGGAEPLHIKTFRVSANFFDILGVEAAHGRTFRPYDESPGAPGVAMMSYGLWQRAFGGDLNLIGGTIRLNDTPYTLVGVTPRDLSFAHRLLGSGPDVWLSQPLGPNAATDRRSFSLMAVARLRPEVTLQQAQVEMRAIAAALGTEYPRTAGASVAVENFQDELVKKVRLSLLALMGAVVFVLLIACVNVANLLLAHATVRQREMALRAALGANRSRLARQVLTESLLLTSLGGAGALLLTRGIIGVLTVVASAEQLGPNSIPLLSRVQMDGGVLAVALLTCLVTTIVCGLVPTVRTSQVDPGPALQFGGRLAEQRQRFPGRQLLMAGQVALALILLIGAGLLTTAASRLKDIPLGFNPENIETMRVNLSQAKYVVESRAPNGRGTVFSIRPERARLVRDFVGRLEALPSVDAAGAVNVLPLTIRSGGRVHVVGTEPVGAREVDGVLVNGSATMQEASPDYFRTMEIPLLYGREFSWSDDETAPGVAIVDQGFVEEFQLEGNAVGTQLLVRDGSTWRPIEIVGVVGRVLQVPYGGSLFDQGFLGFPTMYFSYQQTPGYNRSQVGARMPIEFVVRHNGDRRAMTTAMREIFPRYDPEAPIVSVESMKDYVARALANRRFYTLLMGSFSAISLVLALVGVYGIMTFQVSQRVHEVGVRMALGARAGEVVRMIVSEGSRVAVLGTLVGIAGAMAATRLLSAWLYEVSPTELFVFLSLAIVMVVVTVLACLIPARWAARADPMEALRAE